MANTFSLDDLVQPLTRQEVQASIYEALGILGVNTTSWKSGAIVRTMIVCTSVVLAALSELQAKIARSGFLEYSSGDWLTLVARHVYGEERNGATFATGEVTLSNGGGGVYSFDADDLIFANTITGKTYRNTAAVTVAALETGIVVPIAATEAGAASTAAPHEVTSLVTTVLGVTCDNANTLTGTDEESDAALRTKCSEKLGSLSPFGPWDAYAYAVRSALREDATSIGVTRLRIVKDGYGNVTTYLAGEDGAISGDPDDESTDLGIANAAIQLKAAPLAVTAHVLSAVNYALSVSYEAWMYNTSSLSELEIEDAIANALASFVKAQPIGGNVIDTDPGKVFVAGIATAIFNALPQIFRVDVSAPATDVTLSAEEVTTLGTVTATAIHQEPPPEGFGGTL